MKPENSPRATTLRAAAEAVASQAHNLHRDRDWLWLVGDYREEPELRESMRDAGWRFSGRGHELDNGETAHWYFAIALGRGRTRVKAKRAAKAVKQAVKPEPKEAQQPKPAPAPELYCTDANTEFDALFG